MSETDSQPRYILSPKSVDASTDVLEWSDPDIPESDPAAIAPLATENFHPHYTARDGNEESQIAHSTANAGTIHSGSVQEIDFASMKATSLKAAGRTAEESEEWQSHDSKPPDWVSPAPSVQRGAPDASAAAPGGTLGDVALTSSTGQGSERNESQQPGL